MAYVYFDVTVDHDGPLGLKLRSLDKGERDSAPQGAMLVFRDYHHDEGVVGSIEASHMLRSGDLLMAINGACSTQAVGCRNGANYHGDSVLAEVTAMVRGSPRPLRLRFARAAVGLPSMIHSSLLPPNGQVCLPVLRGLIRRAAKDPNLDALGVAGHRGVVWRVLLGVFPLQTDAWPAKARELRELYREHAGMVMQEAFVAGKEFDAELAASVGEQVTELWSSVHRDVERTYFIQGNVPDIDLQMRRAQVQRILFVYGMFNKGVGYVQGMNEICSGILEELICCARKPPGTQLRLQDAWTEDLSELEADTFWLFSAICNGPCRDAFIADNDNSAQAEEGAGKLDPLSMAAGGGGLVSRLCEFERRLKLSNPQLHRLVHLTWGIRPHVYAARWYSVLFRREYLPEDNGGRGWQNQIWDFMIAHTAGGDDNAVPQPWGEPQADCLVDLCCAYLSLTSHQIAACADANAGLSMLISRRTVVNMQSGPRAPPPMVADLVTEAQRLRQIRLSAEYRQQMKAGVSKAFGSVKGFLFGDSSSSSGGGGGASGK